MYILTRSFQRQRKESSRVIPDEAAATEHKARFPVPHFKKLYSVLNCPGFTARFNKYVKDYIIQYLI